MGFDNARILLDSPSNTYYAGQTLNGRLLFSSNKVKRFRGIYARLHGYCKVHWTSRERNPHSRTDNDRHRTVVHESYEDYFDHKVYLSGSSSGDHELPAGQHDLPFSFRIPDNCPSAIEGEYGHIRYELKVVVDRAFKTDQEVTAPFRVLSVLDLNMVPNAREPIQMKLEESYCCWCVSAGSSETLVKLPSSGYVPGQVIPVELSCANRSTDDIDIKLALKKEVTFTARSRPGTKQEKSKILEEKRGPVPSNTTRNWTVEIVVPEIEIHNLRSCSFISVEYELKVTVSPNGCHEDSDDSCNLIFGSIPLGATQPLQNPNILPLPQTYPNAITQQPTQYPSNHGPYVPSSPFPPNPYPPSPKPIALQNSPPNQNSQFPSPYPPTRTDNAPYPNPQSPYPPPQINPPHLNPQSPYPNPPTSQSPYPSGPPITQSPYPPGPPTSHSPYPPGPPNSQSPYPPGPPNSQSPYPPGPPNSQSPYPPVPPNSQSPYPPGAPNSQSPYPPGPPNSQSSYPTTPPNSKSPYPPGPPNPQSPYPPGPPISQSPYPPAAGTENPPYPITPPGNQYPPKTSPYPQHPYPSNVTTGLKTGTFGFVHGDEKVSIPLLPEGAAVPMPKPNSVVDPYAPSAPVPATPDDVDKPLIPGNNDKTPPPYNPNL